MPLVRISLRQGKSVKYRRAVGDSVHRALVEVAGAPPLDRFQIITEHDSDGLIYDPTYLGIQRTDDVLLIQITFNQGRSTKVKMALYARIAELLFESPGVRKEDVFIGLVEVPPQNWSFGNGEAQYVK